MSNIASAQRRWLAMLLLSIAFGMMVWGRTFLAAQLHGPVFVLYWIGCVVAAAAAVAVALFDMMCTVRGLQVYRRQRDERFRSKMEAAADRPADVSQANG